MKEMENRWRLSPDTIVVIEENIQEGEGVEVETRSRHQPRV
jgi:hypothetical protein